MGTVNANLDPFQALPNEESAFLRAVEESAKSKFVFIIQTNHTTKTCLDPPAKLSRFVLSTKTGGMPCA